MPDIAALVAVLHLATMDRTQLVLENIALRHQLAVYKRSMGRPNIRDRDRILWLMVIAIDELVSAPRSPWQNAYVERLIGSIRRECTDPNLHRGHEAASSRVRMEAWRRAVTFRNTGLDGLDS